MLGLANSARAGWHLLWGLDREVGWAVFMRGDVLGGTADMARDGTGVGRRRHGLRLGYGTRKMTLIGGPTL